MPELSVQPARWCAKTPIRPGNAQLIPVVFA